MQLPRCFLSYCHQDRVWCQSLAAQIRSHGFDLWFDEGIESGVVWLKQIEEELQGRAIFIIVLSPEAWESAWVQCELQLAMVTQKTIIPIMYRETALCGFLLTIQWIDAIGLPPETVALRVASTIKSTAAPPKTPDLPMTILRTRIAPPSTPPKLFIWSIDNVEAPRCVSLFAPHLTIGRESDNDIVLNNTTISRHHATFHQEADGWHIARHTDGGEVLLNGNKIREARLQSLDQIVLGMLVMRFDNPTMAVPCSARPAPALLIDCPECHFIAPLREPELTIGRAQTNAIVIPAPIVSHTAGRLRRDPNGTYTLSDIANRNPMRFNEQVIT